ncbi:MAG: acyl-CoA dehydrogenase family protein [Thermocrispum sp.]
MRFLTPERRLLDKVMPGLDDRLAEDGLMAMEQPGNPGLQLFREAGGPGALIDTRRGGRGLTAVDALRCTRALATRSPSLAVAATMHNFSVASLVALADHGGGNSALLESIATDHLLVSSAFAEGRSGQNVLHPAMRAVREDGRWVISGRKRPCSLSRSMHLMTIGVNLAAEGAPPELGIALVPADSPGITVHPFWNSMVLTGAESDEVALDRVSVDDERMVRPDPSRDALQALSLLWFTLLISGCYLGVASALAEQVLREHRATPEIRARLCSGLEAGMLALERIAAGMDEGSHTADDLAMALAARYSAQDLVRRTATTAVEALGGMPFVQSPEVAYLAATVHALSFHPPSQASLAQVFDGYFTGEEFTLGG